ncbi:speriolin-like protein [Girardinichthys multiradiatus]|uniref:speriolin-like protein n=1 Tax=Girardinichthys multiradiatus TaxID=208333 RepID=UPI001FAE688C|nr:speriolin-like protein [Girardinichthys multiradiatus]
MNLEQFPAALQVKNDQLMHENDHLQTMVRLLQENSDLKARLQGTTDDSVAGLTGIKPSGLWQNNFDERQFKRNLQQTRSKPEHRTSSPVNFKSFLQSSVLKDTEEAAELQKSQADVPPPVIGSTRLFGEIAYQLDRRILSYVFQAHQRLYGFTLLNIPEKIIEVSTHPLTGKVDEGYQLHLTKRYTDLMEELSQFEYKAALHPPFCEFIINTYGILKERPSKHSSQGTEYNNPDFLMKLIENIAPRRLQKDLLLVLSCLCYMAVKDKKPLLAW